MTARSLITIAALCVSLISTPSFAQGRADVEAILYRAADALGMLRTPREVDRIVTMLFTGTGTMRLGGETCELESYRAGVRYPIPGAPHTFPVPGMRADFSCAQSGGDPERHVQVVAGELAWDEISPGVGGMPVAGAARERLFRVWTLPQGLIKAATLARGGIVTSTDAGKPLLSFALPAPLDDTSVEVTFDPSVFLSHTMPNGVRRDFTHRIERVRSRFDGADIEIRYSDYRDWNEPDYKSDVLLPGRTIITRDGRTVLDLTLTGSNTYNPYVVMPVPDSVSASGPAR